jgi:hypothetical protein
MTSNSMPLDEPNYDDLGVLCSILVGEYEDFIENQSMYKCPHCLGRGTVRTNKSKNSECWDCSGKGISPNPYHPEGKKLLAGWHPRGPGGRSKEYYEILSTLHDVNGVEGIDLKTFLYSTYKDPDTESLLNRFYNYLNDES